MRYLGIDFGERNIGVAVSDDRASLAVEVGVVRRRNDYEAIGELREIAHERDVAGLVVGRPTRVDGSAGSTADRVGAFAERLAGACRLPLYFADETLTSVEAARQARQAGSSAKRSRPLDSQAARILLQDWLDERSRG